MQGASERSPLVVAGSLLLHLLLVGALLWRWPVSVVRVHAPGTTDGTKMVLTYLPGRASAVATAKPSAPAVPREAVLRNKRTPDHAAPTVEPAPAAAPSQTADAGADALGEGAMTIALLQFFPDPRPDLSRLPHGSRGDVILNAIIDANGRIAQLTLKQGLGYGVDQSVIATVEQWTFRPATRDGKPVASEQELHFHYERG